MTAIVKSAVIHETCRFLRKYESYLAGSNIKMTIDNKLLSLLGCPFVVDDEFIVDRVVNDHDDVRRCLPKLLTVLIDFAGNRPGIASILSGLDRNQCWDECLNDENDTYSLAAALIYFIENHRHSLLENEIDRDVRAILNAWLKPENLWVKFPGMETLCEHFFGSGWCCMTFPTDDPINVLIMQERPPFLPGLCPAQDDILSVPLPDDVGVNS